VTSLS